MSKQTTAERIAEQARDYYQDTIYSAITAEDVEQADAYTNEHLALTVEVMNALGIFHASSRMLVAIAHAMRWTLLPTCEYYGDGEEPADLDAGQYQRHELATYMRRQAYGDYSHASEDTREEMETAALAYAAQEQTRLSIFSTIGARRARERYDAGTATAADLQTLQALGAITDDETQSYRTAHGWTPRKY